MELDPLGSINNAASNLWRRASRFGSTVIGGLRETFNTEVYTNKLIEQKESDEVSQAIQIKDLAESQDNQTMVAAQCEVLCRFYGNKIYVAHLSGDDATIARCLLEFRAYYDAVPGACLERYFKPEQCEVLDDYLGLPPITDD